MYANAETVIRAGPYSHNSFYGQNGGLGELVIHDSKITAQVGNPHKHTSPQATKTTTLTDTITADKIITQR